MDGQEENKEYLYALRTARLLRIAEQEVLALKKSVQFEQELAEKHLRQRLNLQKTNQILGTELDKAHEELNEFRDDESTIQSLSDDVSNLNEHLARLLKDDDALNKHADSLASDLLAAKEELESAKSKAKIVDKEAEETHLRAVAFTDRARVNRARLYKAAAFKGRTNKAATRRIRTQRLRAEAAMEYVDSDDPYGAVYSRFSEAIDATRR